MVLWSMRSHTPWMTTSSASSHVVQCVMGRPQTLGSSVSPASRSTQNSAEKISRAPQRCASASPGRQARVHGSLVRVEGTLGLVGMVPSDSHGAQGAGSDAWAQCMVSPASASSR